MSITDGIDSLNPTPVALISAADKVAFYNTADNNTYSLTLSQLQDYVLAGGTIDPVFDDLTCATLNVTGGVTIDTSTLKVDSANNRVGIGTATPDFTLQVGTRLRVDDGVLVWGRDIRTATLADAGVLSWDTGKSIIQTSPSVSLVLRAGNSTDRVVVTPSGNVGVSTFTPATTLDVNGATTLRGNVSFLADATHDIGAVASARPRNVYTSGDAFIAGVRVGLGAGAISSNVAVGPSALNANTTGDSNVGIGQSALAGNTTGIENIAIGRAALAGNTTASNSIAIGRSALAANTDGENTAIGWQCMNIGATGTQNTAVGRAALSNCAASFNTAIGRSAMQNTTSGTSNTAVGHSALSANTTGENNVAVGLSALNLLTTGARNTVVGQAAQASAVGGIDQTVIGQGLTGKGNDTAFIGGVNGAYNEKNVATWEITSDERLKRDIADNHDGLDKINAIRVRNFTYRPASEVTELPASAAIDKPGVQLGVIAQEMLPECVNETSDGVKSVSTDAVLWYLVNAVQQLHATVETLKKELGR